MIELDWTLVVKIAIAFLVGIAFGAVLFNERKGNNDEESISDEFEDDEDKEDNEVVEEE